MKLTKNNFNSFAIKYYDNPSCTGADEFEMDLKKFFYLQKLFKKYDKSNLINIRLSINYIVIIFNLFGEKALEMLFFKIEEKHWYILKSFLLFLEALPEYVEIGSKSIDTSKIDIDLSIINLCQSIYKN